VRSSAESVDAGPPPIAGSCSDIIAVSTAFARTAKGVPSTGEYLYRVVRLGGTGLMPRMVVPGRGPYKDLPARDGTPPQPRRGRHERRLTDWLLRDALRPSSSLFDLRRRGGDDGARLKAYRISSWRLGCTVTHNLGHSCSRHRRSGAYTEDARPPRLHRQPNERGRGKNVQPDLRGRGVRPPTADRVVSGRLEPALDGERELRRLLQPVSNPPRHPCTFSGKLDTIANF